MKVLFEDGDQVVRKTEQGEVGKVLGSPNTRHADTYYTVQFSTTRVKILEEDLEKYEGLTNPEDLFLARKFGDHEAFRRRLTMVKIRRPLRDAIYSYRAAKVDFYAYQFKPLLKYVRSASHRLLIADEVGLGKTIEAGYIIREERARHDIQRVLVVCPATLRRKWQNELRDRFDEDFEVFDAAGFRGEYLIPQGQENFVGRPRVSGIVSLQSLRNSRTIDGMAERLGPLDLVIVDEAHHCRNSETASYQAIQMLTEVTQGAVFLTATPIHLGNKNLFNLLRLLMPEEFDDATAFENRVQLNRHVVQAEALLRKGGPDWQQDVSAELEAAARHQFGQHLRRDPIHASLISELQDQRIRGADALISVQNRIADLNILTPYMSRTRKRDVHPDAPPREPYAVSLPPTTEEAEVYERLSDYCYSHFDAASGSQAARFAQRIFQRQYASSLHATVDWYCRLADGVERNEDLDAGLEQEVELDDMAVETVEQGKYPAMLDDPDFRSMVRWCQIRLGRHDTKLEHLFKAIDASDKIVVFAFFKRSLRYLEEILRARGIECERIDGDVPANPEDPSQDERHRRIERFRDDPKVRVLLSSEVGAEGLDFQFCSVIFNWDLPWNPMVVEQRIGRIDRLGQKAPKLQVYSVTLDGTIEEVILRRLYERIGIFRESIGILEQILGDEVQELTSTMLNPTLTLAQKDELAKQKGLAIAQRRIEEARFNEESVALVGQDDYFTEQVGRVGRLGLFVAGEELRQFVEEGVFAKFPDSQVNDAIGMNDTRIRELTVGPDLRRFLTDALPRADRSLIRFEDGLRQGKCLVTFDADLARRHREAILVTATHPLVRALAMHYDEHSDQVHSVTRARLTLGDVPVEARGEGFSQIEEGHYAFRIDSIVEAGLLAGRDLWVTVLDLDREQFLDREESLLIMRLVQMNGTAWNDFSLPDKELNREVFDALEDELFRRQGRYREAQRDRVDSLVEQRKAALDATYRVRRIAQESRIATLLEKSRGRGQSQPKGLKGFESRLEKMRLEFEDRTEEIESSRRRFRVESHMDGGGYFEVCE